MLYGHTTAMLALGAMLSACGERQAEVPELEAPAYAEVPIVVQVEGTCKDTPLASHCWKQLKDPAGCYFWTDDSDFKFGSVAWSGKCLEGMAEGPGALAYISDYEDSYDWSEEGLMEGGRKRGDWIEDSFGGRVTEVTYANGKRNGKRLVRNTAGNALWDVH